MKFTITTDQRNFYDKFHLIEFENLLSQKQVAEACKAIEQTLAKENGTLLELWNHNSIIKKTVTHLNFAQIAADLTDSRTLRIGSVQLLPDSTFENFSEQTIEAISSIQGVQCALMLCLESHQDETENKEEEDKSPEDHSIFSDIAGNGIFFDPAMPIPWSTLSEKSGNRYLMITYARPIAVYIYNKNDPNNIRYKKLGYTYGDKLKDNINPIVYRR